MPGAPRQKGKATKIALKIKGPPVNADKKTKHKSKIEKRLEFEETNLVK